MKRFGLLAAAALLSLTSLGRAQQPDPAPSNLEAGGLRPPDAVDPNQQTPTDAPETPERELEEADKQDSGRGLEWIWLNAEVGVQHLGLQTLKASELVDAELVETTQTGLTYGAGIGVRLLVFTVGARFRLGS